MKGGGGGGGTENEYMTVENIVDGSIPIMCQLDQPPPPPPPTYTVWLWRGGIGVEHTPHPSAVLAGVKMVGL